MIPLLKKLNLKFKILGPTLLLWTNTSPLKNNCWNKVKLMDLFKVIKVIFNILFYLIILNLSISEELNIDEK